MASNQPYTPSQLSKQVPNYLNLIKISENFSQNSGKKTNYWNDIHKKTTIINNFSSLFFIFFIKHFMSFPPYDSF
jgi:hypothetical protein